MNVKSSAMYLFDPNSQEYAQMQEQMSQQQQAADLLSQQQAEFNADMTHRQVSVLEGQLELDVLKEQNRMVEDLQKQDHKEEESDSRLLMDVEKQNHDMEMDEKELAVEKTQKRNVSIG